MRDIGIFTTEAVPTEGLRELINTFSEAQRVGVKHEQSESVIGGLPDVLYVRNLTPANNAYYGEDEKRNLELKLGFTIKGFVSIHFTSSDTAHRFANDLAEMACRAWGGVVDFRGAGGDVGSPPKR